MNGGPELARLMAARGIRDGRVLAALASDCAGASGTEPELPLAAAGPAAVTQAGSGFVLGEAGRR